MSTEAAPAAPDAPVGRRVLRAVPSVLFYVCVAVAAWFLWPTSLGGCTTLTVVTGHSMEPTYYTGDLVVARCGTPQVGDVVVYRPDGLGADARIVHRIVGESDAGWTLQGDNNDFIDVFAPSNDEVVGIARLHIPKIAYVWEALTSPLVWGGLLLLAAALVVWPRGDDEEPEGQREQHVDEQVADERGGASVVSQAEAPTESEWAVLTGESR